MKIPKRLIENARRVGGEAKYHNDRCQAAAKQERYRKQSPTNPQDRIHFRNLVAHGMIAEKLLRDPATLSIARENLARWRDKHGDTPALREWQRLLESERGALLVALVSVDEEGMRLRSSSPFTNVLSEEERALVFKGARK